MFLSLKIRIYYKSNYYNSMLCIVSIQEAPMCKFVNRWGPTGLPLIGALQGPGQWKGGHGRSVDPASDPNS